MQYATMFKTVVFYTVTTPLHVFSGHCVELYNVKKLFCVSNQLMSKGNVINHDWKWRVKLSIFHWEILLIIGQMSWPTAFIQYTYYMNRVSSASTKATFRETQKHGKNFFLPLFRSRNPQRVWQHPFASWEIAFELHNGLYNTERMLVMF